VNLHIFLLLRTVEQTLPQPLYPPLPYETISWMKYLFTYVYKFTILTLYSSMCQFLLL
jgi:hypothetical protein